MTQVVPSTSDRSVKQFNVYVPPGLIRRVKHHAVDSVQSLSAIVEKALIEYLKRVVQADPAKE